MPQEGFLQVSRSGVAKQESYTNPSNLVREPEILEWQHFRENWRCWGVQASKFMKFVRWRDFNALRRPTLSFTWLVEWLHRRVISSTGAIARRMPVVRSVGFRTSPLIFVAVINAFWKSFEINQSARVSRRFPASITARRCQTRKLYESIALVHAPENFEMTKCSKILTLLRGSAL